MKVAFYVVSSALLFAGCQKNLSDKNESLSATVSSNALQPLPCHSTAFVTDYPVGYGKVPPFKFTKTLYADSRVKSINMLSRANPIHPAFKPQAWELIGQFTYSTNAATFTGTKELWEYYITSTGAAGKRSIVKKNVSLGFTFTSTGACYSVYNHVKQQPALRLTETFPGIDVQAGSDEPTNYYYVDPSEPDNKLAFQGAPANIEDKKLETRLTFTFSSKKVNNISYQPTQNWFSLEYTLLEVMQWLPSNYNPAFERTNVAVSFYPNNSSSKVTQSQVYKNHQYDAKGNLTSYTYGDNIAQKTTWYCK